MMKHIKLMKFHSLISKCNNFRRFLKDNILQDIYRQNKAVLENSGINNYGDGQTFTENNLQWQLFKSENIGKNIIIDGENIKVKSDEVMRFTDRLFNALSGNEKKDMSIDITSNNMSVTCLVPYYYLHHTGQNNLPVRRAFFAGNEQIKKWKEMLFKYIDT
jgi:hypothetical protein